MLFFLVVTPVDRGAHWRWAGYGGELETGDRHIGRPVSFLWSPRSTRVLTGDRLGMEASWRLEINA